MPLRIAPIRFALAIAALLSAVAAAEAPRSDFTLQDFLGRTWRNEYVEFPLSKDQDRAAKAGHALVGPDEKAVLYQPMPGAPIKDPGRIAFLADLDPFETRVYRFVDAATQAQADLVIEETAESIRIANGLTGISIRRKLGPDTGPIGAMRVEPNNPASLQQSFIYVRYDGQSVGATFPLGNGARRWMITALNKEESLSLLTKKEEKDRNRAPRVQRFVVKHAHFPLKLLKGYVYVPPKDEEHPRLFVTPDQVRQFRKTFQADPAKLAQLTTTPVNLYAMDDWITYYLGTGDGALGKHLSATAVQTMQHAVDAFLDQDYPPVFGLGNSNDDIFQAANLSDAILDDDQLSPELRQRLRAQIAWLAYTVNRDDYVFLSGQPFTFKEGDIAFEGTSGSIQQRGNRIFLSLGAAGSLSVKGKALKSDRPAEREW